MYSYNFIITKQDLKYVYKQSRSLTFIEIRQRKFEAFPFLLVAIFGIVATGILLCCFYDYLKIIDIIKWITFLVVPVSAILYYLIFYSTLFLINKKIIGNVINVELDEDKVSFYGFGNNYVNCLWSSFVNVYKEKNMLFLIPMESTGEEDIFIPKRLFSTEQEFNEVFNYIKTNIDKNRQLK